MTLTAFQRATLINGLIEKAQVIDPDTGGPVDWDALGSTIDGISDVPGLQAALDAKQAAATAATDAELSAAIAALSSVYQALDSDLTAIAALTTTSFGRSLLAAADASALQTLAGASAFIKTLLDDADAATARTTLGVTPGATAEVNAAARVYASNNFR